MKKLLGLITAGALGGLIALAGVFYMMPQMKVNAPQTSYAQNVNNKINVKKGTVAVAAAPLDFKAAAKKAMPVVVHISATESTDAARKRRQGSRNNNPFDQFFGGDSYGPRGGSGSGVIFSRPFK